MKILIVSATPSEIEPVTKWLDFTGRQDEYLSQYHYGENRVDVLITGVGMVATSYHLGRYFGQSSPDLAINAGIAGTFDPLVPLGSVFNIAEDEAGDFGALERDGFKTVFELGLANPDLFPYSKGKLQNIGPLPLALTNASTFRNLIRKSGITTNTIKEKMADGDDFMKMSEVGVESMEGAAFFYACISAHVPAIQIRAVSNDVGERDKSKWAISLAIKNLNQTLKNLMVEIYQ